MTANDARRPASLSRTDFARMAGVSLKTVSRVVNDEPHISSASAMMPVTRLRSSATSPMALFVHSQVSGSDASE